MATPEFQAFMAPILRSLVDGETRHWRDVRAPVDLELGMTDTDRAETISSGKSRFDNRLNWGVTHLFQAGLVSRPRRAHIKITTRGRSVLTDHPDRVDMNVLDGFAEYRDFRTRTKTSAVTGSAPSSTPDFSENDEEGGTPLETIDAAVRESHEALTSELLQRVFNQEPVFLEHLVLQLLTAMGYGGRAGVKEHWGRSGDGGIDGVVQQDVLGLDRVYVQAKRFALDRAVGRPDIQSFVGALHGVQADRGVFITTSRFSNDAESYVERIPNRIVMIDGQRLARLMVLHDVGVQEERTFTLKKIDEDFFEVG